MSFWASDSRSPYGQTSLSIVAENGKQFNQNAKVVLVVQPDVTFFQPSESYLIIKSQSGPSYCFTYQASIR